MSNVCRAYDEVCEHATEYGYCRLTACAKRPQTITVSKDKTMSYTNDVVEVVRCKDCKEYQKWYADGDCICMRLGSYYGNTKPTDYCSYGERKDK